MQNLAAQVAIAEVLEPTLGVTEQVLAVHTLAVRDGSPEILLVDGDSEPGAYYIYFGIDGEPYHFVVIIGEKDKNLVALGAYIEAAAKVCFLICSTVLHPDTITERVQLNPTSTNLMGEARFVRNPKVKYQEHCWEFEPQKDVPGNLENKLNFLLDRLELSQEAIASLQDTCEIYICICYEGYVESMGGLHIDRATIQRIAALGAEVDLDLYACGEWDLST